MRDGRFVLLAPVDEPVDEPADEPAVLPPARVRHATPRSARLPSMLVRPDGYIAWASAAADPATRVLGLRSALAEWCGLPPESSVTGRDEAARLMA